MKVWTSSSAVAVTFTGSVNGKEAGWRERERERNERGREGQREPGVI